MDVVGIVSLILIITFSAFIHILIYFSLFRSKQEIIKSVQRYQA